MPFETPITDNILLGDDAILFSTASLGTDFGEIMKCELERTGKEIESENNKGGLRALILANPGFALSMDVTFDINVDPPGPGDAIVFPYAGVTGRVLFGAKISWESKSERKLSFKAAYWDSMGVSDVLPGFSIDDAGVSTALA